LKKLFAAPRATLYATGAALTMAFSQFAPASGQDYAPPHSSFCGAVQDGVWVSNGNCTDDASTAVDTDTTDGHLRGRVAGTITSVSGHLVTLQQSSQSLVVNDQPALNRRETGRVAVGRQVVAHGYWLDGTFFATSLE
jgi:hypothetical protein